MRGLLDVRLAFGLVVMASTFSSCATLHLRMAVVPNGDPGRFDVLLDNSAVGTGVKALQQDLVVTPGAHALGARAAAGTDLSRYEVEFLGACAPGGSVVLAQGEAKACAISVVKKGAVCQNACKAAFNGCMAGSGPQGPSTPKQCLDDYHECLLDCRG